MNEPIRCGTLIQISRFWDRFISNDVGYTVVTQGKSLIKIRAHRLFVTASFIYKREPSVILVIIIIITDNTVIVFDVGSDSNPRT